MKRADLIALVEKAADLAALPQPEKGKIVEAISNPSVTRVARGDFEVAVNGTVCHCPLALAGFYDFQERVIDGTKIDVSRATEFYTAYDHLTHDHAGEDLILGGKYIYVED